jgi:N-formylmethionyl-tRNA deformylase
MRNTYKKLEVLHFPDPRLRKIAKEVDTFDNSLQTLIDDMFFTMYEEKGIGLAANSVDIHKRILLLI